MNKLIVAISLLVMATIAIYLYYFNFNTKPSTKVESLEGLSEELDSLLNNQGN